MMHWAAKYLGLGYTEAGMCWGLVQTVCRERLGVEMPAISIGSACDQSHAIRRAVQGWRRRAGIFPLADEIVVMTGTDGPHVGYAIDADGHVGILHAHGTIKNGESFGKVVFDPWHEVVGKGFRDFEFWERA